MAAILEFYFVLHYTNLKSCYTRREPLCICGWSALRPDDVKTMTVLQITQAVAQNPDLHKKLYAYYIGTHHINFSQRKTALAGCLSIHKGAYDKEDNFDHMYEDVVFKPLWARWTGHKKN